MLQNNDVSVWEELESFKYYLLLSFYFVSLSLFPPHKKKINKIKKFFL